MCQLNFCVTFLFEKKKYLPNKSVFHNKLLFMLIMLQAFISMEFTRVKI